MGKGFGSSHLEALVEKSPKMGNAARDLRLCGVPHFSGRWVMAQALKTFNCEVRKEKNRKGREENSDFCLKWETPREKTRGVFVRKECFS
jgi:hypothetical protein